MGKGMLNSVAHTRDKVRYILETFPETRNNDNLLCSVYWREFDEIDSLEGVQFATSAEAIRRSRQLLNSRGIGLPTDPEVLKKRRKRAKEMRMGITKI